MLEWQAGAAGGVSPLAGGAIEAVGAGRGRGFAVGRGRGMVAKGAHRVSNQIVGGQPIHVDA